METCELIGRVEPRLLIGGQWRDASDGGTFEVANPATGEVIATLASATAVDALAALDAASGAQQEWAQSTPRVRSDILRAGFDLVRANAEELAWLIATEMGKPLPEARAEVAYGNEFLRWFSEEAPRHYGRYVDSPEGNLRLVVRHQPVGPCLLITPWNFPLAMATRKIAPALAAGCTMVVKAAKLTPLTTQYLAQLLLQAGVPDGVLNVLPSSTAAAISSPLMRDPRLRKVSFTGSTAVGKSLLRLASENVLRTSMELGGNAPFLVFADADLDAAVEGALAAKLRNIGQACTAANRFLVQAPVAEEFAQRFAARLGSLQVGAGTEAGTQVGPLIEAKAVANLERLVRDAEERGAQVLTGGRAIAGVGNFFQPTLLWGMGTDSLVFREEIFGPVAPVFSFGDEDEAVALANDTEYGLASYVYTSDARRLQRIGDRLEFGLVGLNVGVISNAAAPFGGVKQSGLGREGGAEGIAEYSNLQYQGAPSPWL